MTIGLRMPSAIHLGDTVANSNDSPILQQDQRIVAERVRDPVLASLTALVRVLARQAVTEMRAVETAEATLIQRRQKS
jgi:hypothetical protein